jgi:hypothetical protein
MARAGGHSPSGRLPDADIRTPSPTCAAGTVQDLFHSALKSSEKCRIIIEADGCLPRQAARARPGRGPSRQAQRHLGRSCGPGTQSAAPAEPTSVSVRHRGRAMLRIDRRVVADWGRHTGERPFRLAPTFLQVHRDTDRVGLVGHGVGQTRSTGARPLSRPSLLAPLLRGHRVRRNRVSPYRPSAKTQAST